MVDYGQCFHGLPEFVSMPPLRGKPDAKSSGICQWYTLWKRKRNPHIYMVMALGSCVKVDVIVIWLIYPNPASLQ